MPRVKPAPTQRVGPRTLTARWTLDVDDYVTGVVPLEGTSRWAVALASGRLQFVGHADGRIASEVAAHANGLGAVAARLQGDLLVTGGLDGTAKLFDAEGRALVTLPHKGGWVEKVAWSPDGTLVATACGKVVRVWHADGRPFLETEPHESTVTDLAFSPDGRTLATCCYGGVRLWPLASGEGARHFAWKGSLISLVWSPDGKVIVCGSQDCSVHFWRVKTGDDSSMSGYPLKPKALAFSADGLRMATSGSPVVCVWRFEGKGPEGTKPLQLEAHAEPVTVLAAAPKGNLLASGAADGELVVWNPSINRKPRARTGPQGSALTAAAWWPDVSSVISGTAAGRVVLWSET
jgi:WD40 repeat protein